MRRLGVDPGSKRVGLAASDEDGRIALPHGTLEGGPAVAREIAGICRELAIAEVVVGLPLMLDGTEGSACARARKLATAIETATALPVVLWDERLTTVVAERALREQSVRGKAKRAVVDQAAATLLLQSYLDAEHARRAREAGEIGSIDWHEHEPPAHVAPTRAGRRRPRSGR